MLGTAFGGRRRWRSGLPTEGSRYSFGAQQTELAPTASAGVSRFHLRQMLESGLPLTESGPRQIGPVGTFLTAG